MTYDMFIIRVMPVFLNFQQISLLQGSQPRDVFNNFETIRENENNKRRGKRAKKSEKRREKKRRER